MLIEEFPNNIYFKALYCETMLLSNNFKIVEKDLAKFKNHPKPFYQFLGYLFSGWIQEKAYGEMSKAESDYLRSIEISEYIGLKVDHYLSLSYSGLGRVYSLQKDHEKAKKNFRLALKYANFPRLEEEPRRYLNKN